MQPRSVDRCRLLSQGPSEEHLVTQAEGPSVSSIVSSLFDPSSWLTSSSTFTGDGTAFSGPLNGSAAQFACAYHYVNPQFSRMFAAMNIKQWEGGAVCGRCIKAKCVDPKCETKDKEVVVQILDLCPECKYGDVDFSYPAYSSVTGCWPDRLKVEWEWTSCAPDISGTIKYSPKPGSNYFWQAFFLSNSRYPLKSVKLNGQQLSRSEFNFYVHGGQRPSGSVVLELIADSGDALNATINDMTKAQDLGVQFPLLS